MAYFKKAYGLVRALLLMALPFVLGSLAGCETYSRRSHDIPVSEYNQYRLAKQGKWDTPPRDEPSDDPWEKAEQSENGQSVGALFHEVTLSGEGVKSSPAPTLAAGLPVTLTYSITDRVVVKLGTQQLQVSQALQDRIASGEVTSIDVDFRCSVCILNESAQTDTIDLDPRTGTSTEPVIFNFTPVLEGQASAIHPPGFSKGITLVLSIAGQIYDQLHICVTFQGDTVTSDTCGENWLTLAPPVGASIDQPGRRAPHASEAIASVLDASASVVEGVPAADQVPGEINMTFSGRKRTPTRRSGTDVLVYVHPRDGEIVTDLSIFDEGLAGEVMKRLSQSDRKRFSLARHGGAWKVSGGSGYRDLDQLGHISWDTYLLLSCATSTDKEFRTKISKAGPSYCAQKPEVAGAMAQTLGSVDWSSLGPQRQTAAQDYMTTGGDLIYQRIFADPFLDRVFVALAGVAAEKLQYGARPIRLSFNSDPYHVQFQMAHVPGSSGDGFVGLNFDLVDSYAFGAGGVNRYLDANGTRQAEDVRSKALAGDMHPVIALYTDGLAIDQNTNCDSDVRPDSFFLGLMNDRVLSDESDAERDKKALQISNDVKLVCQHYKDIYREITQWGAGPSKAPAVTADEFLRGSDEVSGLVTDGQNASLIWYYGHGETRELSENTTRIDFNPRLVFGRTTTLGDEVAEATASQVSSLGVASTYPLLKKAPLVVLVACELGAPSPGNSGQTLPRAFFELGARGVIASEAEIDANSASLLGRYLLQSLNEKYLIGPSEALLIARRRIHSEYGGNLWPLLMYYTGAHGPYLRN